MIVGKALQEVFKDLNVNGASVQFWFGDQKEFVWWQSALMKAKKQRYPLIWYVISEQAPQRNGFIDVESELYLFMDSKPTINNMERVDYTYKPYLEPLYKLVNQTLARHPYIVLKENPIKQYPDQPNFGTNNDAEFTDGSSKKDPKAIGLEIVDAKILKIKISINTNCILL